MRLLGLDLGEKRIGVAVAESDRGLAFPDRVLQRKSAKADRQAILALVRELAPQIVILGLPLTMDGDEGPNAERARDFGEYLRRALPVPLELWDERMTTVEAEQRLRESGLSAVQRRQRIDAAAAAIILEDYLRAHPS